MNLTLLDIIGLLMIFGCGIIGYVKGAINTLIGLAGFIASFLIAKLFTPAMTDYILHIEVVKNFITNTITQNVVGTISAQSNEVLTSIQGMAGTNLLNNAIEAVTASQSLATADAVVKALEPIIYQITSFFVFVIILLGCNILISMIKRIGRGINRVPVIGTLNRVSGMAIGLTIGGILLCLMISIVLYYAVFTGDLSMVQMVKGGVITGPVSIYLH
ncbi:MAG: CvpA family protein [Eubacterium sp.]